MNWGRGDGTGLTGLSRAPGTRDRSALRSPLTPRLPPSQTNSKKASCGVLPGRMCQESAQGQQGGDRNSANQLETPGAGRGVQGGGLSMRPRDDKAQGRAGKPLILKAAQCPKSSVRQQSRLILEQRDTALSGKTASPSVCSEIPVLPPNYKRFDISVLESPSK